MPFTTASASETAAAWARLAPVIGDGWAEWRYDDYGALIYRPHFGMRESGFGWELTFTAPVTTGAGGSASARPIFWRNGDALDAGEAPAWRYDAATHANVHRPPAGS